MPSVNSGPSNSASVNTQTPAVVAQAAATVSGIPVITQGGASVGNASLGLLIAQNAVAVGIANTGTIGANGALTLGTALQAGAQVAYGGTTGIYFNFPAGAVFASSPAGFYFTRMTSTTAGTVFNNTYVAANGLPTIPSALVPVVDAGPGAYTGVTTAQTALQVTVPANVLGNNGALQVETLVSYNNSAGTKTFVGAWGGTTFFNGSATTTVASYFLHSLINRGVPNTQILPPTTNVGFGQFANALSAAAVDTTQPSTLTYTLTLGTATDSLILDFTRIQAFYAP